MIVILWFTEYICKPSQSDDHYSAIWHDSYCYVTFVNERVTWYEAASKCIDRNGRLASFDVVNTTFVAFLCASLIPTTCVWLGLVKNYVFWTIPDSELLSLLSSDFRQWLSSCFVFDSNTYDEHI